MYTQMYTQYVILYVILVHDSLILSTEFLILKVYYVIFKIFVQFDISIMLYFKIILNHIGTYYLFFNKFLLDFKYLILVKEC